MADRARLFWLNGNITYAEVADLQPPATIEIEHTDGRHVFHLLPGKRADAFGREQWRYEERQ